MLESKAIKLIVAVPFLLPGIATVMIAVAFPKTAFVMV